MTPHYPDLGNASDWLKQICHQRVNKLSVWGNGEKIARRGKRDFFILFPNRESAHRLISHAARLIRSTIQIWVVACHKYGIFALVSQTSFRWETSGGVENVGCFLKVKPAIKLFIRGIS